MENNDPTESLPQSAQVDTEQLTSAPVDPEQLRLDIRWSIRTYGNYLIAFAVGSLAIAFGFAELGPKFGAALVTPIWVVFILMISLFAARQQDVLPGLLRLHGVMIASWAVVWMAALFGSIPLGQAPWWWVVGGIAMTIPPLVTRLVFLPRLAT